MTVPDPNRLGGLEWARRTRGKLTAAERRRLIGAIAVGQAVNIVGRVKLALGRLPDGASAIDVCDFEPPDSRGLSNTIKEEARAVPGGRFGLLRRCGMTLAVRMAPFDS